MSSPARPTSHQPPAPHLPAQRHPCWAQAKGRLTIRLSHIVAEQTPKGLALQYFKNLLEERSAGGVQVLLYLSGQLYGDNDEMQALQLGAVGQRLLQRLGRQRLVGLGFFDNGFKQMSANRPLLEPADFRNLPTGAGLTSHCPQNACLGCAAGHAGI